MQRLVPFFLAAALAAPPAGADNKALGETKVLAMLKANTVVQAAVAQGKRFSGAKACHYAVKAAQPREFEPNTTYDYTATITCGGGGDASTALIAVTGRMFQDGPQALKLSLDFAG